MVRESIVEFLDVVLEETLPLAQLGLPFEKEEAIAIMSEVYSV